MADATLPPPTLSPEDIAFYLNDNVTHVYYVNRDTLPSDDEYDDSSSDFPVAGLMVILIVLAASITSFLFYMSYWHSQKRDERLAKENHQNFHIQGKFSSVIRTNESLELLL